MSGSLSPDSEALKLRESLAYALNLLSDMTEERDRLRHELHVAKALIQAIANGSDTGRK